LKSGAHYQDLWSAARKEMLEQDEKWKDAGLTAIPDTGFSPGMAQILSAYGASKYDTVDEITVRLGRKVAKEDKEYVSTWSHEITWWPAEQPHQISETAKPKERYNVVKAGKLKWEDGLEEDYAFPEPIGTQKLMARELTSIESTAIPNPRYVNYSRIVSKSPVPQPGNYRSFVRKVGLLSEKPIEVKGVKIAPRNVFISLIPPAPSMEEMEEKYKAKLMGEAYFGIAVEVRGKKDSKFSKTTLFWRSLNYDELWERLPGATTMSYMTSVPASILTRQLGKGQIKNKGCFPPEGIEPKALHEFVVEMANKGMPIQEKVEGYIT